MKRVLTGRFMHETNTFSDRQDRHGAVAPARLPLSRTRSPRRSAAPARRFGATFEAADKYGWTLVHPVSANANPSGTVTDDAFETIGGMVLAAAERQGPIDGVLLAPARRDGHREPTRMARASCSSGCAGVLGPDVPIVVTLDLHANVTQKMADNASALIAFRTYPHIDMYERAWQGAELLQRAMQGEIRPQTVIARRPMIYGPRLGPHARAGRWPS